MFEKSGTMLHEDAEWLYAPVLKPLKSHSYIKLVSDCVLEYFHVEFLASNVISRRR